MLPTRITVHNRKSTITGPAHHHITEVHILRGVVRALRTGHAVANSNKHAHTDAGEGLEHRLVTRPALTLPEAGRAGCDDDGIAHDRAADIDVVVVGSVVVRGFVLLVKLEVGHRADPRDMIVGAPQLGRHGRGDGADGTGRRWLEVQFG